MMQSAAVLTTESPVKSLPEILGVPLQRKTFNTLLYCRLSETRATCAAGSSVGTQDWKQTEDEQTWLNLSGCHAQAKM